MQAALQRLQLSLALACRLATRPLTADRRQTAAASCSVKVQDAKIRCHQLELVREVDACHIKLPRSRALNGIGEGVRLIADGICQVLLILSENAGVPTMLAQMHQLDE